MSFLYFVLVLFAIVMIHEFGHFIAAKKVGMKVKEFAFGFPPRLISKKYKDTEYSINSIWLGGYVSILGENDKHDKQHEDQKIEPGAFSSVSTWRQLVVVFAGVFMNFVLAFVLFFAMSFGEVTLSLDDERASRYDAPVQTTVVSIHDKSVLKSAGINTGDEIVSVSVGGVNYDNITNQDLRNLLSDNSKTTEDEVIFEFNTKNGPLKVVASPVVGVFQEGLAYGISFMSTKNVELTLADKFSYVGMLIDRAVFIIKFSFGYIGESIVNTDPKILDDLSGPVGIAKVVMDTSREPLDSFLFLTALLSINVAVFNLLPLPALDGGRALIIMYEGLFRRKVKPSVITYLSGASFIILILLTVIVTYKDIIEIIKL